MNYLVVLGYVVGSFEILLSVAFVVVVHQTL